MLSEQHLVKRFPFFFPFSEKKETESYLHGLSSGLFLVQIEGDTARRRFRAPPRRDR